MNKYFVCIYVLISLRMVKIIDGCDFDVLNARINCSWNDLSEIPRIFPTKIEVFDFTGNRLRVLNSDSFAGYTNIRVLMLKENFIDTIEEDTFSHMSKLTSLDLRFNILRSIPCNLPSSLTQLYLNDNPLDDDDALNCFHCLSSLTSLEILSLSQTKMKKFPRFCEYTPNLQELDVFQNSFDKLAVENLAVLCGLQRLNISTHQFSQPENLCQCMRFEKWIHDHNIQSNQNICSPSNSGASQEVDVAKCLSNPNNEAISVNEKCLDELRYRKYSYLLWASGWILLIISICLILFAVRRCKQKRKKMHFNGENVSNMTPIYENRQENEKTEC